MKVRTLLLLPKYSNGVIDLSTYYDYYVFIKKDNEFKYAGYYDISGHPLPIYYHTRSFSYGFLDYGQYINDLDKYGIHLPNEDNEEDEARFGYIFHLEDIDSIPDKSQKEAYIYKTLKRDMEINHFEYDIGEYLEDAEESVDGHPLVICKSEYDRLSLEEKKDYFYYRWTDYEDMSYHRNILCAIIDNWINIRQFKEFNDVDRKDIYIVAFGG